MAIVMNGDASGVSRVVTFEGFPPIHSAQSSWVGNLGDVDGIGGRSLIATEGFSEYGMSAGAGAADHDFSYTFTPGRGPFLDDYAGGQPPAGTVEMRANCVVIAADNLADAVGDMSLMVEYIDAGGHVAARTCFDYAPRPGRAPVVVEFGEMLRVIAVRLFIRHAGAAASGVARVGFMRPGIARKIPSPLRYTGSAPLAATGSARLSALVSGVGEPVGLITESRERTRRLDWPYLREAWARDELPGLRDALSAGGLVFVVPRPIEHPDDVVSGWITGRVPEPSATGQADLHSWSLEVSCHV